jgi:hypothetical protein
MNAEANEYDLRQVVLMEEQLNQFEDGKITLSHIISGLKSLQNCLTTTSADWRRDFIGEWWNLEQIYAVALDRKRTELSSDERAVINQAIVNLRALVIREKQRLESESDTPS